MRANLYDQTYYRTKYILRPLARTGLAHLYYLWIAFFCIILPAKLKKGDKVLDIGCGVGYLVWALRKFGIAAFGFDPSIAAKEFCLEPQFCTFSPIKKIPFKNNSFDLVCSNEVLEHVLKKDLLNLIKEMKRVSRGKLIQMIGVKDRGTLTIDELSHVTVETEKWWEKLFKKSGFKVKLGNLFYFFPYLFSSGSVWNGAKRGYFYLETK